MLARTHRREIRGRSNVQVLVIAFAALLALIAWFVFAEANDGITSHPSPNGASAQSEADGTPAPLAATDDTERAVVGDGAALAPSETSATATSDDRAVDELRGRVVTAEEQPIAGAEVTLRRGELRAFNVLDFDLHFATEPIASATTDASGEFRFELARGIPVDVHVTADEFAPAEVPARHAGEFVVVSMSAGVRVFGRVTRAADLAPVADARVRGYVATPGSRIERTTVTAGNGTYELHLPECEQVVIEVVPLVERCPEWAFVTIGEDGRAEQNFVVEDGTTVTGRVTSAADGKPIAGAVIGEGWVFRRTAVTNDDGEYTLHGFGDEGLSDLHVRATGFGKATRALPPGSFGAELRVDFELTEARRAHGRVVDTSGAPLQGVLASAVASEDGDEGQRIDWVSTRTDAAGRFELESLTPDLRHVLMLSQHGFATCVYDFPLAEFADVDLDLGEFVLVPPALVAGVIEDDAGSPLENIEIVLDGSNADRGRLQGRNTAGNADERAIEGGVVVLQLLGEDTVEVHHSGDPTFEVVADTYTELRTTHSDAQGRFSFGDLPAGSYTLRADMQGRTGPPPIEVTVAEGSRTEDLRLVVTAGSRLSGRVVDPDGAPVARVYVQAQRAELRDTLMGGGAALSSGRTDSNGRFVLEGLAEGEYDLNVWLPSHPGIDVDAPLMPARLDGVRMNATDVEIVLPRGTTIRGTLRDAAGKPLGGHGINVMSKDGASSFCTTDADGAFCLPVELGRVCDLAVAAPVGELMKNVHVEPRVVAGTHGLEIVVP